MKQKQLLWAVALAAFCFVSIQAFPCDLAKEIYEFPFDPGKPFFPAYSEIYCKKLANNQVVNLPLRETNGDLVYAIGIASLEKIKSYLSRRGSNVMAKANADDPTKGTVKIAYYDMHTNMGPFHSLALTIVTESGALPAAFHYVQYYAHEPNNRQWGIYQIGVDKIQIPMISNVRDVLELSSPDSQSVQINIGTSGNSIYSLHLDLPQNLSYKYVDNLAYSTSSEGAVGGVGPQRVLGNIRGRFSAPIPKENVTYQILFNGKIKDFLTHVGFELRAFQVVKNFDLVEK